MARAGATAAAKSPAWRGIRRVTDEWRAANKQECAVRGSPPVARETKREVSHA